MEGMGCHCLCAVMHPDDVGVCTGEEHMRIAFFTEALGRWDVPFCAACATHALAKERKVGIRT